MEEQDRMEGDDPGGGRIADYDGLLFGCTIMNL